jgi:hypothetical protein
MAPRRRWKPTPRVTILAPEPARYVGRGFGLRAQCWPCAGRRGPLRACAGTRPRPAGRAAARQSSPAGYATPSERLKVAADAPGHVDSIKNPRLSFIVRRNGGIVTAGSGNSEGGFLR